jgi:hypothetical protein
MPMTPTNWIASFADPEWDGSPLTACIENIRPRTCVACDGIADVGRLNGCFARLQNFRRLVVRYEGYAENFLGMLPLRLRFDLAEAFMTWVLVSYLE